MSFFLVALRLILAFVSYSTADEICLVTGARAAVVRDRLYWMAGQYLLSGNHSMTNQKALYWLELGGSSSFPVEGFINDGFLHKTSISTTPYQKGGVFWVDKNQTTIYTVGGSPAGTGVSSLPAYNASTNVWQSVSVSGGPFNEGDRYPSMYASSFEGGGSLSFLSGGQDFLRGMVVFDSSDPQRPSWENITNDNIPYFWGGTTQYVRYGSKGILVSIGGMRQESVLPSVFMREMNSVQVYDIAAQQWSTIFATGDIPSARSKFCSALTAAPDDSSFHIIIHGGWDEKNAVEDVYILVMPAFHWIKINTTTISNKDSSPYVWGSESKGRIQHYCSTYKDRHMLVLGGQNNLNINKTACDSNYPALRLLDTTTLQWQTQFPLKDGKYTVPQPVIDIVGGSPEGGAKPASTWSQRLGDSVALFSKTIPRYDPEHPPPINTDRPSAPPAITRPATTSSSRKKSAIIGGVVGGVVGLALWSALVYFYLRRKKHHQQRQQSSRLEGDWHKPELPPGRSRSVYPKPGQRLHEAEGDDPVPVWWTEMDSRDGRVEAPEGIPHRGQLLSELDGRNSGREYGGMGTRSESR